MKYINAMLNLRLPLLCLKFKPYPSFLPLQDPEQILHQWRQFKHTHQIFFLTKRTLSQALRNMDHVHHEISWNNVVEEGSLREHKRAFSSLQVRCKEIFGFYHAELLQDPVKLLLFVAFTIQQQLIGLNKLLALHNNFPSTHTPTLTKHTCWMDSAWKIS